LIYWYGVLSKKFRASFSSTTSQKTQFYFYPISLMSIPPLHTILKHCPDHRLHHSDFQRRRDVFVLPDGSQFNRLLTSHCCSLLISLVQPVAINNREKVKSIKVLFSIKLECLAKSMLVLSNTWTDTPTSDL